MEEPHTWQEILRKITLDTQERLRIANELGVSAITLTRWATNNSKPKSLYLRKLVQVIPRELKAQFVELVAEDYPDIILLEEDDPGLQFMIPAEFYDRVLKVYSTSTSRLRSMTITNLVLQQVLDMLDPTHLGMLLTVMICMRPKEGSKIRSLRSIVSRGTPPWRLEHTHLDFFRGAESLEGFTTAASHPIVVQSIAEGHRLFPSDWMEEGAASFLTIPLSRGNSIAGVFCIYSTQSNYFSQQRMDLASRFANLLLLSFADTEFFPVNDIQLGIMPDRDVQRRFLADFGTQVTHYMQKTHEAYDRVKAEINVMQDIEEKLLQYRETP